MYPEIVNHLPNSPKKAAAQPAQACFPAAACLPLLCPGVVQTVPWSSQNSDTEEILKWEGIKVQILAQSPQTLFLQWVLGFVFNRLHLPVRDTEVPLLPPIS